MFLHNPLKLVHPAIAPHTDGMVSPGADTMPSQAAVFKAYGTAYRVVSFQILLVTVLATYVFLLVPRSVQDPDIWWHLRNVTQQLHTSSFLHQDMYSFSAPHAHWINHEWLAELPFYLGWSALAEQGLYLVMLGVLECIFAGVFLLAYRRCRSTGAAVLITIVAAFFSTVSFGPRTLLFGWLGLTIELLLLQGFADGQLWAQKHVTWAMPLLFFFWVNAHGSWIIGLAILFAFLLCGCVRLQTGSIYNTPWNQGQRRTLILAASLSVISLFANPYGWELVCYPFDLAFHQKLNIASIEEWQSLDFHTFRAHVFLFYLLLAAGTQVLRPRMWTLFDLVLVGLGVYAALTYSRFLFLAAILILPLFANHLAALHRSHVANLKPRLNAVLTLAVLLGVLCRLHSFTHNHLQNEKGLPTAALPYLQNLHPQSNVLNDFNWGGYLEWYVRDIPVLIDSRVDIFERRGVLKDYLDVVHLKNTLSMLDTYKIGYVVFSQDAPLVYLLRQTHQWRTTYHDPTTIVLKRCTGAEDCVDSRP